MNLKGLVLAGGMSSRMGTDKGFLPWTRLDQSNTSACSVTKTMFEWCAIDMAHFCKDVYVSLRLAQLALHADTLKQAGFETVDRATTRPHADASNAELPGAKAHILLDDEAYGDIGPAVALLTAFDSDPLAHWLVCACDFPFICAAAFAQLVQNFAEPLTCFKHPDGNPEPLLAIWSPTALQRLKENVLQRKRTGPCFTLRELLSLPSKSSATPKCHAKPVRMEQIDWGYKKQPEHGNEKQQVDGRDAQVAEKVASGTEHMLCPQDWTWLVNTNTAQEFDEAKTRLKTESERGNITYAFISQPTTLTGCGWL